VSKEKRKFQNPENSTQNISALQMAVKQCVPLPQNRVVTHDASAKSSKKS